MKKKPPVSTSGFVQFPTKSRRYRDTGEGGLAVYLVVVEKDVYVDDADGGRSRVDYTKCYAGTGVYMTVSDLVGSSVDTEFDVVNEVDSLRSPADCKSELCGSVDEMRRRDRLESMWFPQYHAARRHRWADGTDRFQSRPFLAAVLVGSTSWAGAKVKRKLKPNEPCYFVAGYADLDAGGKQLWASFEKLYGEHGDLVLLTFLDT